MALAKEARTNGSAHRAKRADNDIDILSKTPDFIL
jgi:hypothetical protein